MSFVSKQIPCTYSLNGILLFFSHSQIEIGRAVPTITLSGKTSLHSSDPIISSPASRMVVNLALFVSSVTMEYTMSPGARVMEVLVGLSGVSVRVVISSAPGTVMVSGKRGHCGCPEPVFAYLRFCRMDEDTVSHESRQMVIPNL